MKWKKSDKLACSCCKSWLEMLVVDSTSNFSNNRRPSWQMSSITSTTIFSNNCKINCQTDSISLFVSVLSVCSSLEEGSCTDNLHCFVSSKPFSNFCLFRLSFRTQAVIFVSNPPLQTSNQGVSTCLYLTITEGLGKVVIHSVSWFIATALGQKLLASESVNSLPWSSCAAQTAGSLRGMHHVRVTIHCAIWPVVKERIIWRVNPPK